MTLTEDLALDLATAYWHSFTSLCSKGGCTKRTRMEVSDVMLATSGQSFETIALKKCLSRAGLDLRTTKVSAI